jgi:hypothetical protein
MALALNADETAPGMTEKELERVRLLLSTYQDGSGGQRKGQAGTIPDWRNYERVIAVAFGGKAPENKAIFDVHITHPEGFRYGISCKMKKELRRSLRPNGRVYIEVSNAVGTFMDTIAHYSNGLTVDNYRHYPTETGAAVLTTVQQLHEAAGTGQGGPMTLSRSSYLVLQWSAEGFYRFYQYPIRLPDASTLTWTFPSDKRIRGVDHNGEVVIDWYRNAGQLKYYPLRIQALWASKLFTLEPLPRGIDEYGMLVRAKEYFPDQWKACNE